MQQPADVVVRPAIKHVPRFVVCDAHERIVRCGCGSIPNQRQHPLFFYDAKISLHGACDVDRVSMNIRNDSETSLATGQWRATVP